MLLLKTMVNEKMIATRSTVLKILSSVFFVWEMIKVVFVENNVLTFITANRL